MRINNLQKFISILESRGELSRVAVSVDPILEIAAITNRVCKQREGGTALLFEHPAGSCFRVATNLFGSRQRTALALGVSSLDELTIRLRTLLERIPEADSESPGAQIVALPEFTRFAPHSSWEPDAELVAMPSPDITSFPFLHSWPEDGAASGNPRYITLPQVITTDPDGGTRNCGMYRVQLRGKCEVAVQWKTGSGAARHAEQYRQAGRKMPIAIVLGGDPATLFSAMFQLPGELDELTFAGFLRGAPLVTTPCQSVPLQVPIGAEVVIEGYVQPSDTVIEGSFGNHSGFYSPAAPASLMRITAIRHRINAIIPATVVGPPPMEDCWMTRAWERLLLAFLQKTAPSIADIHFPFESVFHQSAIISLENPLPGMVRKLSAQIWNLPWFSSARVLIFVTAAGQINDLSHAVWRTINVTDFNDDVILDRKSGRVAIDATECRLSLKEVKISAATAALVERRWKEYKIA